jgi:hypothetical protein
MKDSGAPNGIFLLIAAVLLVALQLAGIDMLGFISFLFQNIVCLGIAIVLGIAAFIILNRKQARVPVKAWIVNRGIIRVTGDSERLRRSLNVGGGEWVHIDYETWELHLPYKAYGDSTQDVLDAMHMGDAFQGGNE